ncbi:MAG: hypothetical protein ACYCZN_01575 [Candidatus Dormibacteria bacterium]
MADESWHKLVRDTWTVLGAAETRLQTLETRLSREDSWPTDAISEASWRLSKGANAAWWTALHLRLDPKQEPAIEEAARLDLAIAEDRAVFLAEGWAIVTALEALDRRLWDEREQHSEADQAAEIDEAGRRAGQAASRLRGVLETVERDAAMGDWATAILAHRPIPQPPDLP